MPKTVNYYNCTFNEQPVVNADLIFEKIGEETGLNPELIERVLGEYIQTDYETIGRQMINWLRSKLYDLLFKLYSMIHIKTVKEEGLNIDDWGRIHKIAENEIRVSKKIRKYAIAQSQTPLNQERGGRSTLKVIKGEVVELQKPPNRETDGIWLKRRLTGLPEYRGEG